MKIAIGKSSKHPVPEGWINYCNDNKLEYKFVDPYSTHIIDDVQDCDIFLWYIYHTDYRDMLFAKQLFISLELAGKKVFPNYFTSWHFDDKLGQAYALKSIGAPHIPTYVFYTKKDALDWIDQTQFPKVMKLRGGAGGRNVILVKSSFQAKRLARRAFNRGFSQTCSKIQYLRDQITMIKNRQRSLLDGLMKGIGIFFVKPEYVKMHGNDKGYIMFQDFVPNNNYDIRLIVIGNRAYGMKRLVRTGDFRASGSGKFVYDEIPQDIVKIAFDVADKLHLQSVAFDFMYYNNNPVIIEMCYGFGTKGSSHCKGYWDRNYNWHEATPNPNYWELEDLLAAK